jgi:hypothetical protein
MRRRRARVSDCVIAYVTNKETVVPTTRQCMSVLFPPLWAVSQDCRHQDSAMLNGPTIDKGKKKKKR